MDGVYAVGGLIVLILGSLFIIGAFRFVFSGAEPDTCPYDKQEGERGISGEQWASQWQADTYTDVSQPTRAPAELRRIRPEESHRPRGVPSQEPVTYWHGKEIHWSKPVEQPPAPIEVEHSDDGLVRGFFAKLFNQDQDRDQ